MRDYNEIKGRLLSHRKKGFTVKKKIPFKSFRDTVSLPKVSQSTLDSPRKGIGVVSSKRFGVVQKKRSRGTRIRGIPFRGKPFYRVFLSGLQ